MSTSKKSLFLTSALYEIGRDGHYREASMESDEMQAKIKGMEAAFETANPEMNPVCQICGESAEEVDDDFMVIGEVSSGVLWKLCYDCAAGVPSSLMASLDRKRVRQVFGTALMSSKLRNSGDEVAEDQSYNLTGLITIMNPAMTDVSTDE